MTALFVKSTGTALLPDSKAAQIALAEFLPRGVPLKIEPRQPRNLQFHKLAWAFFTYVASALNDGPAGARWTPDDVKDDLLVATGHAKVRPMSRTERERNNVPAGAAAVVAVPKSISFSSMDQDQFGRFMEAAFIYVRDDLCRWIEGSPHWEQIGAILAACHMAEPRPDAQRGAA